MQFYELNSSRMDYRELSADDLDLLTPLLRSESQCRRSAAHSPTNRHWTGWWIRCAALSDRRGCGWLLALDKPTGVPAALCGPDLRAGRRGTRADRELASSGMSCAASASAASASPRACCMRSSPCTPTRSAPSCRRDDLAGLHTAVACRMQPTEKVSYTAFGKTAPMCTIVWSGIRTSRRRQNLKMNYRKIKEHRNVSFGALCYHFVRYALFSNGACGLHGRWRQRRFRSLRSDQPHRYCSATIASFASNDFLAHPVPAGSSCRETAARCSSLRHDKRPVYQ